MIDCPFYLVDAFAHKPLAGNPAGVCLLEGPVGDAWMQKVAAEINQAETAFLWPIEGGQALRWFTPTVEVSLCGHATLAAASVLGGGQRFSTLSGWLTAKANGDEVELDFPAEPVEPCQTPFSFETTIWQGRNRLDWFVVLESAADVYGFRPDFEAIERAGMRGLCITAPSDFAEADFVSRFFAPQSGVPEDSVTGGAHCGLACLWADRFGREALTGFQASTRTGFVGVERTRDRVRLSGRAIKVVEGRLRA